MIHYAEYMEGAESRLRNDNKFISNAKSRFHFATQFRFFFYSLQSAAMAVDSFGNRFQQQFLFIRIQIQNHVKQNTSNEI